MDNNYEEKKRKIKEAKQKAKIFLPTWEITLEEFIDIYVVFNKKSKVKNFMRFFIGKLIEKSEELFENGKPPLCYFDERTNNLAVDYGAFLNYLTEWIAVENRIEKDYVSNYIYYYFGLVYSSNYNFPAAAFIKLFLAGHYFVFKVFNSNEVTKYLTYPAYVSSKDMNIYKLNCLFIHQNYLERIFDYNEFISLKNRFDTIEFTLIKNPKMISDVTIHKVFKDTKLGTFK